MSLIYRIVIAFRLMLDRYAAMVREEQVAHGYDVFHTIDLRLTGMFCYVGFAHREGQRKHSLHT